MNLSLPDALSRLDRAGEGGFLWRLPALTVYWNPRGLGPGAPRADIVLLSSAGGGHCSQEDVRKISDPQTIVAGPAEAVGLFRLNQLPFSAGRKRTVLGLPIEAFGDGEGLGFLVDAGGVLIGRAGSGECPALRAADIALLEDGLFVKNKEGTWVDAAAVAGRAAGRVAGASAPPPEGAPLSSS